MSGREWFGYGTMALIIATAVHFGTVYALPRYAMTKAVAGVGAPNIMHFGRRPDETSRTIVRPSPDLLYSLCPFDLSQGSVRLKAVVPQGTYWSISLYDSETNNFYVKNDRQLEGRDADIVIAYDTGAVENDADRAPELITAPTRKGLALIRMLVSGDSDLPRLEKIQHLAHCELQYGPGTFPGE